MDNSNKKYQPTPEELASIEYINLHAHSDLSIKDGIADPKVHFKRTISAGHCGCCITDHGSYASSHTLLTMDQEIKKKNFKHKMLKGIKEELELKNKSSHMVVTGCELYIYDDRAYNEAKSFIENKDQNGLLKLLLKLKTNPLFSTLFKTVQQEEVDVIEFADKEADKNSGKYGDLIINEINSNNLYSLSAEMEEQLLDCLNKCYSNKYNHITVLAKNETGFKNICLLNAISFMPDSFYTKPRVRLSDLLTFKEGLIATTGCFAGMIPGAIDKGTGEEKALLEIFLNAFKDDFYVEIHIADIRHKWDRNLKDFVARPTNPQEKVNLRLLELVEEYNLHDQVYITQDSHLPRKEDKKIQDLILLSDKKNKDGWRYYEAFYIMTVEEMWEKTQRNCPYIDFELFKKYCETSVKVAKKCNITPDHSVKLDTFKYWLHPMGVDLYDHSKHSFKKVEPTHPTFYKLCPEFYDQTEYYYYFDKEKSKIDIIEVDKKIRQIESSYGNEYFVKKVIDKSKKDPEVLVLFRSCVFSGRVDFDNKIQRRHFFREMNICLINGYVRLSPYFAILEEIASWSKRNLYVPGPGRGSAAGSFLNYALNITDIHSIKRNLSFERFISRERIGYYVLEPVKGGLKQFLKDQKINSDEYPVEWLNNLENIDQLNFHEYCPEVGTEDIELFKSSAEYEYLKNNPEIIEYLLNEVKSGKRYENNLNNSVFTWLLGITPKPQKPLTEIKGSMPDIDFDTPERENTIKYLVRTRGPESVCLVGTYSSLKLKSSIKEILKLSKKTNGSEFTYEDQNLVTKELDAVKFSEEELKESFDDIFNLLLERSTYLKNFFNEYPTILENVLLLAGAKSGIGIHAGGVLVGDGLIGINPTHWDKKTGCFVSQLDKNQCEQMGLQKIDLLGLETAAEIQDAFHRILKRKGISLFGKLEEIIEKEDAKVLESIRKSTAGLFQIMSSLPTGFFQNIKFNPTFNDIPLVQAMYRPGPMGAGVPKKIIKIKNKEEDVIYSIPELKQILEKTYGEIVYQEQIMNICMFLADFTPFEADDIRRAMGKKDSTVIDPYAEKFVEGASKKFPNIPKDEIVALWEKMYKFAEYGFNESHAVAYSSMSFIQAYLREYFRQEWIAAALNISSQGNSAKQAETYKTIIKIYKDQIRPPNINSTVNDYQIEDELIYLPLYICKGLNSDVTAKFIKLAPYKDIFDLYARCDDFINKTYVEALITSGSLDSLMPSIDGEYDSVRSQFLIFLKEIILKDYLSHEESEYIANLCNRIKFNPKLFDEVKDLECISKEWNNINFRKFAYFIYFGIYDSIKVKKEIKDMPERKEYIYTILSNPTPKGYNIANVEINKIVSQNNSNNNSTISFFEFADDIMSGASKKKSGKQTIKKNEALKSEDELEKVTGYFTGNTLEKLYADFGNTKFDSVRKFLQLSVGKLILLQNEYLNATTVDFTEHIAKVIPRAIDSMGVSKIYDIADLENITTKNMNIIMEVYERINFQKIEAIRNKESGKHGEAVICAVTSGLNCSILRRLLGKYQSKRSITNTIDYLSPDPILRDSFLTTIALSNSYDNYKDLFTYKNKIKLKTAISKKSFDWINKLSGARHEKELDQINAEGYLEIDSLSLINLIFSKYVLREGLAGFNFVRSIPFAFDYTPMFKSEKLVIKEKVIGKDNIEEVRNALDLLDMGIDLKYVVNKIADGMQSEYLNIDDFINLGTIAVAGVIYTPEDNKKFKKEQFNYLKKKKTVNLRFSLANRQAEYQVVLEDSEGLKRYEISEETGYRVPYSAEKYVKDYSPIVFMVNVEYHPQDGVCTLKVDGSASSPYLPLMQWI